MTTVKVTFDQKEHMVDDVEMQPCSSILGHLEDVTGFRRGMTYETGEGRYVVTTFEVPPTKVDAFCYIVDSIMEMVAEVEDR